MRRRVHPPEFLRQDDPLPAQSGLQAARRSGRGPAGTAPEEGPRMKSTQRDKMPRSLAVSAPAGRDRCSRQGARQLLHEAVVEESWICRPSGRRRVPNMAHENNARVHQASADVRARTQVSFAVSVWHWFSLDQAIAATLFSRKCAELEANPAASTQAEQARGLKWSEATQREHRSFAAASILASVAFLEASVNELFASTKHENLREVGASLQPSDRTALTAATEMLSGNRLLDRFQLALLLLRRPAFDIGAQPYQDAVLLVRLRNELVHYTPQFRSGASSEPTLSAEAKWLRCLESKRFSINPFTGEGNPFFPDKCLCHGCTMWAWNAAVTFCDSFFNEIGVTPMYDNSRELLNP